MSFNLRRSLLGACSHEQQMLRIPRFRIEDDSYVEMSETSKSVAKAMADSSMTEFAAELAMYALTSSNLWYTLTILVAVVLLVSALE